jgi:hypothetical protein
MFFCLAQKLHKSFLNPAFYAFLGLGAGGGAVCTIFTVGLSLPNVLFV